MEDSGYVEEKKAVNGECGGGGEGGLKNLKKNSKVTSFDEALDDGKDDGDSKKKSPTMYQKIEEAFSEFAENTSAHGIPRVYTSPTSLKRSLWLLLFFSCLAAFSLQAFLIVKRFFRNDIIVGVELKFENIPFPSVTVCNLNPYKNSLARTMGSVRDTLAAFDTAIEQSGELSSSSSLSGHNSFLRRKRAHPEYEIRAVQTFCSSTFNGMNFADKKGTLECFCLQNVRNEFLYECSGIGSWEERFCHECDERTGICESDERGKENLMPCLCKNEVDSGRICVAAEFEHMKGQWPINFLHLPCSCSSDDPNIPCHPKEREGNSTNDDICLCASPSHNPSVSEANYYCALPSQWKSSKCSECNWNNECIPSVSLEAPQNCLCHSSKCLAISQHHHHHQQQQHHNDKTSATSSQSSVIRVRRQIRRVYEKIYNRYDGLLAVYSICECKNGNCQVEKKSLKDNSNETICLCFFNRKNGQIWPCYPEQMWAERRCHKCSPLGDCAFSESEGQLPCVCAAIIRMCVRIDDASTEVPDFINVTSAELGFESGERLSLGDRIPKIWEITTTEMPIPEDVAEREEAYGFKGITDPVAIRAKATENLVFAVSSLPKADQSKLSYNKHEFITKCSFNGRACSINNDFDVYIDPSFGNCFTFNYNASENMTSERAGPSYGLRFQVFVNISDYMPTTEAAGVRITVHSKDEQPFPDTHGYSAPTGFVSSFGIRLKRMNRLPAPYGECTKQAKTQEYIYQDKEYSTEGCQRSCIQHYLIRKCGCGDPRFPQYRNATNCPVDDPKLRACLRKELKYAARDPRCVCKQPCFQEVFSVSYSCARWPASTSSLSDCDPSLTPVECLQFYREQGALIEVYFEQLNYESLLESEAYGLPNLLSDFGGQLGLWMGVSVITIMEVAILIGELLFNVLCCCCRSYEIPPSTRSTERRFTQRQSSRRRVPLYPNGSFRYDLQRPYIFNGGGFRRGSPPLPHVESGYDIVRNIR